MYSLWLSCFFVVYIFLSDNGCIYGDSDFRFPTHDGVKRTVTFNKKNFDSFVKKNKLVVTVFMLPPTDDDMSRRTWEVHDHMMEMAAQVLERRDIVLGYINMVENVKLTNREGVKSPGAIHVYKNGVKIIYYGHRSPEVLVSFIIKLEEKAVSLIDGKTHKKAFDSLDQSKVVAYLEKGSQAHKAYEEAAVYFQPYIPFYIVFDAKVAKHLKMKNSGTILFFKPYEKKPLSTNNLNSADEVKKFINKNKRQVLKKLALDDIHSTWTALEDHQLVLSFMKMKTSEGSSFFKVLKAVTRNYAEESKVNFVWVDPENFPMMVDYWQSTYKVDFDKPSIGVINVKNNNGTWFYVDQLQKAHSETHKVNMVLKWLKLALAGELEQDQNNPKEDGHLKDSTKSDRETVNTSKPKQNSGKTVSGKDKLSDRHESQEKLSGKVNMQADSGKKDEL